MWNSLYNPDRKNYSCSVNAQSPRPDSVQKITIDQLVVFTSNFTFSLSVKWEEPTSFNGAFVKYEVLVGSRPIQLDRTDTPSGFDVIDVLNVS